MTVLSDTVTALSNTVTFQLGEQNRRLEAFEQRIISVDGSLNEFRKELEGKIDKANGRSLTIIGLMLTVATLVFTAVTYVFSTMPAGSTP